MMSRRTRPSARTTRTAPTAPCVPVARDGARVPRSVPAEAGPVTGMGSCTSVEGGSERSTGSPDGPQRALGTARLDVPGAWPAGSPSRSVCSSSLAALAIYMTHRRRPLLRPFRVAGLGVPRGPGGDPLSGAEQFDGDRERLLPGRPAGPDDRRHPARPPAVPAAARRSSSFRSSRSGASPPTTRRSSRSSPRSTSRSAGGRSAGCRSRPRSASRRPSSSPSGRSSGTRPSWRRPGTRPTSSRSG